jgi:hypothetical protein
MPESRTVKINPQNMMVSPAAIMLVLEDPSSPYFSVGIAFDGMTYPFYLLDKVTDPWFEFCSGCEFRKEYEEGNQLTGCPGGLPYLKSAGWTSTRRPVPVTSINLECQRVREGEINFDTQREVLMPVKIPPFLIRYDFQGLGGRSIAAPFAFVLKPNPQTLSDYFYGAPFVLGNVDGYGSVCLGSTVNNFNRYSKDVSPSVNAFFQFKRNNDYFASTLGRSYRSIAEYAHDLNAFSTDEERANHIAKYCKSGYFEFKRRWISYNPMPENKYFVLPPTFKKIEVQRDQVVILTDLNDRQFKLNGTLEDYTLEPVENEN